MLFEIREKHHVFGYSKMHPCIHEQRLYIECVEAVRLENRNHTDQFLTWACALTVFAQRITFPAIENAAYIGCVRVLVTDIRKPSAFLLKRIPSH